MTRYSMITAAGIIAFLARDEMPTVAEGLYATAAPSIVSAVAYEGTTVVDVRSGELRPNQVIIVTGDRITAVGPVGGVAIPPGARVVSTQGTYAIPGLWDMHTHTLGFPGVTYPLFIANGVTGVREMSVISLDSARRWRQEVLAGARVGPRTVLPGPFITDNSFRSFPWRYGQPWGVLAATPEDGRRIVDSLKQAGADFIKIYHEHSRETYFAIAGAARRAGLRLEGHLPGVVTPVEASDSGQRSLEHSLVCDIAAKPAKSMQLEPQVDPEGCRVLAERFRTNGTWFSIGLPMALSRSGSMVRQWADLVGYWPDTVLSDDSTLLARGISPYDSIRYEWATASSKSGERSIERWAVLHRGATTHFYRDLQRAGVRMLAGTDTGPIPFLLTSVPGFALHDLLWLLVADGLTPLEALQTATLNPAEFYEATDSLGTVAAGKLADIVFLDANPLQDIYNTRRIRAVVANGRFFDRDDIDQLLMQVERDGRIRRP